MGTRLSKDVRVPTDIAPLSEQQPPARKKRQILGPTGLVVMVAAIFLFTAVSILIEISDNRGKGPYKATVSVSAPLQAHLYQVVFHVKNTGSRAGRPDTCDADLLNGKGERVGTATIFLKQPIPAGSTLDMPADAPVGGVPVTGQVTCSSFEPQ